MKEKITKGIKGFNKDLTCKDLQYKEGETFKMEGDPKMCERGFHFCTEPLDILDYYNPADSVYHYVEGYGKISKSNEDSKVAVSKIKIGAKLSIAEFANLSFEAILKRCKDNKTENSGDRSMASNSGDRSMASNSGDRSMASNSGDGSMASNSGYGSMASNSGGGSMASNSGDRSMASNSGYGSSIEIIGEKSLAIGFGMANKAKASLGSWICLAEWIEKTDGYDLKTVKTAKIDGKKLLPNTWYILKNGRFIKDK